MDRYLPCMHNYAYQQQYSVHGCKQEWYPSVDDIIHLLCTAAAVHWDRHYCKYVSAHGQIAHPQRWMIRISGIRYGLERPGECAIPGIVIKLNYLFLYKSVVSVPVIVRIIYI